MENLQEIAALIAERNAIDAKLGAIIGRPALMSHLGEWIAAQIFKIVLEDKANQKAYDGHFTEGALVGRNVNVKWYRKHEFLLDISSSEAINFYLVITGRRAPAESSKGKLRPLEIESVYLFDAKKLRESLTVKIGISTSVRKVLWEAAEIYPRATNPTLVLTEEQRAMVALFAPQLP